ncbi:MAG: lipoate--protein ligase family protein [Bacteroidales bacterium]|nr:lipoate--protein ligase family protein [Bacteroidales bacterium]
MLFIERPWTDPFFNLAAEEYIFRSYTQDDVIMLWRNEPSVIVGKHQNPFREINIAFARENHLPVIRRISGGGTVYHDPGNLNFTFIHTQQSNYTVDYNAFLQPVISVLNRWNIPCERSGKSDLFVHQRKISGNSQHLFKNRVLHHGTLLYSTDLDKLNQVLVNNATRYTDKSIRSNPAAVANISEFLNDPPPVEIFQERLAKQWMNNFSPVRWITLSASDEKAIQSLSEQKYRTWEWNFGYSPPYQVSVTFTIHGKEIRAEISVRNGIIRKIHTFEPVVVAGWMALFRRMEGLKHEEQSLQHYLDANPDLMADLEMTPQDVIRKLF